MSKKFYLNIIVILTLPSMVGCWKPWPLKGGSDGADQPVQAQAEPEPKKGKSFISRINPFNRNKTDVDDEDDYVEVQDPTPEPNSPFGKAEKLVLDAVKDTNSRSAIAKLEQAKDILEGLVRENPRNASAFGLLGDCYYNLEQYENGIQAYVKARTLNPSDYLALRGKGFCHLHYGKQLYRQYQQLAKAGQFKEANELHIKAHENFKRSLELMRECQVIRPGDSEAIYVRAMAAEGASRLLYVTAVNSLKLGKHQKANERMQNCLQIIDEGLKMGIFKINQDMNYEDARVLVGNLYFRRACLYAEFGETGQAMVDIKKAIKTQQSILTDLNVNNDIAKSYIETYKKYAEKWQNSAKAAGGQ